MRGGRLHDLEPSPLQHGTRGAGRGQHRLGALWRYSCHGRYCAYCCQREERRINVRYLALFAPRTFQKLPLVGKCSKSRHSFGVDAEEISIGGPARTSRRGIIGSAFSRPFVPDGAHCYRSSGCARAILRKMSASSSGDSRMPETIHSDTTLQMAPAKKYSV